MERHRHPHRPRHSLSPTDNALTLDYLQPYVTPSLSLRADRFEGRLSVPLLYTSCRIAEREESRRAAHLSLYPSLRLDCRASERLRLSADIGYDDELTGDQAIHDGTLLVGYYLLTRGASDLERRQKLSGGAGLEYRNPVQALFANVDARCSRHRSNLLTHRQVLGDYLVTEQIPTAAVGDLVTLGGRVSKGISLWRTTFALKGLCAMGNDQLFLSDALADYRYGDLSLSASAAMRPSSLLSLTYEVGYGSTREGLRREEPRRRRRLSQMLEVVLTPHSDWRIEASGHHYYNELTGDLRKHYFLMDLGVVYSPRSRMELSLTAHNLLNNRTYGYTLLSSLTGETVAYDIRPLELAAGLFFHF